MKKTIPGLVCLAGLVPHFADAHGYTTFPKARQVICSEQGGQWGSTDGSTISNLGCRAAFVESGTYQFVQTNEFAANVQDYTNLKAVEQVVVDGSLCSGGDSAKSGMSVASAHWTRTPVVAGDSIKVEFLAAAPHNPSYWEVYMTKPGYDASAARLAWSDLEQIATYGNLPFVTKNDGRYYEFDLTLPAGRTGEATMLIRWQREDAGGEGFYNCSDLKFDGDAPQPAWSSAGTYVKPGLDLKGGESVWFRIFDVNGSELVFEKFAVTAENLADWPQQLAALINQQYSSIARVGLKDAAGNIAFDATDVFANQVYVSSAVNTFTLDIKADANQPNVTVSGLQAQYQLDASNTALVSAALDGQAGLSASLIIKDAKGTEVGKVFGVTPVTLTAKVAEQGEFTADVEVTDKAGKSWPLASQPITVQPQASNDYDFVFPDGLASYKAGTRVLATDGGIYECKPFPYEGWCRIYTSAQNVYEPGVGANWSDAWEKR
uniref:lytic polysaccharide monooxygenase n=1 Tax=Thaumasiovibrio occultus TaxID=1891184 RepID=UPI00131D810C|nr:lytic polysaccharide monooxygenase [Thaumasiovibrio occultus]